MKGVATALVPALLAVACGDPGSRTRPPQFISSNPVFNSTPTGHFLSGLVIERTAQGMRPVPAVTVDAWVDQTTSGFHFGQVSTDATGRYRLNGLPDGFTVLYASGIGYDQPCAATIDLSADAALDIELVSERNPSPATTIGSPMLSGAVFETTMAGRRPVPDARVSVEWRPDLVTATTTTDSSGHYSLCRLPTGYLDVSATKAGYALADVAVQLTGDTVLDLNLEK